MRRLIAGLVVVGSGMSLVTGAPTTSPSTGRSTTSSASSGDRPDDRRLRDAIEKGDNALVSKLIDAGADLNDGTRPALLSEIAEHQVAIARLLLERGASPDSANKYGCCALFWTIYDGEPEIAQLLLGHGASTEPPRGPNPLITAVQYKNTDFLKLLLEHRASVAAINEKGDTALHVAVREDKVEAVKMLIAAGADPNLKNKKGRTPLYMANVKMSIVIREAAKATTQPAPSSQPVK